MSSNDLSTSDGVFSIIHDIADQKENLTLTSTFRGLNLNHKAKIFKIQKENIYLKIDDYRIFSFPVDQVILHHRSFSKPVHARYQNSCWINEGVLILTKLEYKETDWIARTQDRVQPRTPTYINFQYRRKLFRGDLENIAVSGLGMIVDRFFEKEIDLAISKKILLNFTLPPNYELGDLPGTIINLRPVSKNLMRMGIHIFPKAYETSCLKAYVSQRKTEILDELDQVSVENYEREDVFGLYF